MCHFDPPTLLRVTVVCISNFTPIVTYVVKHHFLATLGRRFKWYNILGSQALNQYRLEVSKKVQHDLVPHGASKIQDAKVGSPSKLHFCTVNQILQTLTDCNFGVS